MKCKMKSPIAIFWALRGPFPGIFSSGLTNRQCLSRSWDGRGCTPEYEAVHENPTPGDGVTEMILHYII